MTSKASCDWCGAEGWSYAVRRDGDTGMLLCGFCRGRDLRCFSCRAVGHEVVDDDIMCLPCSTSYKEKRAQTIRAEFLELVGIETGVET